MDRADYAHWNSADVARLLALLESERRYYQEIVAGIPVGLLVVSSDLRVLSANAAVRRIFGLQSADPIRGSLDLLLPRGILERVAEVLRGGRPQFGHDVTTRPELGNRRLRIGIRPMTGWDPDNPREALIAIEDLTGLHPAADEAAPQPSAAAEVVEQPVESTTEGLPIPPERELINKLNAAVWACELPEMRFIFVSEGAVQLLEFPTDRWMDDPEFWSTRIDAADREQVLDEYARAIAGDGHFTGEFRVHTAAGRMMWVHESARVVEGNEGRRYLVGFSIDTSDRRAAENAMVTRERLDALRGLSARLSHDLNNMLMIVTGYMEDALAGVSQGTPAHTAMTAIRIASERLAGIAGQLRTFATYSPGAPGAVELNALLERVRRGAAGEQVHVQPAASPIWARADGVELEEAVRAAVSRAVGATRTGGDVTLAVSTQDGYASIEIRDTAAAMTPGERSGFFEQLLGGRQRSEDSVAVLSRAYMAVEHWGGRISVESGDGGNLVRILLPITDAPAEREQAEAPAAQTAEEPAAAPEEAAAPKKILVVEDEAGIRALVRKILERHGYTVLDSPKAEEALNLVQTGNIDLVITDLMMPDMSGQQMVERLKQVRPDIRVLFISGYTDDTSMYTRKFGNGTAFLQKPFSLGALVGKVREVLGGE